MSFNQFQDATTIATMIQSGEMSAEEAVTLALETIDQWNDATNAVVYVRREAALEEARSLADFTKPFAGVPILLKDMGQAMAGLPSTQASRLFKDHIATQTNYFVQSLLDAGFIVVGMTNAPEFGFKNQTDSKLYGDAHLPLDTTRTTGGSSGGSAAALLSGMVPIVAASDGGGSIRIPSSYNGLIGLKPTRARTAQGPGNYRGWAGASISFALTRTMRDTERLLLAIQTEQDASPYHVSKLTPTAIQTAKQKVQDLRIAYTPRHPFNDPVSPSVIESLNHTVQFLKQEGFNVTEVVPTIDYDQVYQSYVLMNAFETAASLEAFGESRKKALTKDEVEPFTWALYQFGLKLPGYRYPQSFHQWDAASEAMGQFHQSYDLLLEPTTTTVAPVIMDIRESTSLKERMTNAEKLSINELHTLIMDMFRIGQINTPFNWLYNLTGQPSISLPLGRGEEDLPLGLQFTAKKACEDQLLAIGYYLEEQGQFYQPKPEEK
ncbi:MAG: amidase [Aerococcus sp.]|nr:amidase [Aerococcus sp.]